MDTLARFGYFPNEILLPVIKISYWRYRFSEIMTEQRLSLDCHIRSTMIIPGPGNGEKELEVPGAVIEIKGQAMELPEALKQARILYTDWTRFSKYSACIDSHTENFVKPQHPAGQGASGCYRFLIILICLPFTRFLIVSSSLIKLSNI